ncbi:MAG TPA: prephenate dehydratase [Dehalococcoidia bacterium]|nr:prephenate dehydratase [Dehalococcoidia bacterium]
MAKRLAYLGPPGTFSEAAALRYDATAQLLALSTIAAVASAVEAGMADEGVLPFENSLEGSVAETLDLLTYEAGLSIKAELVLRIEHCLVVRPGTEAEEVRTIYSHPQALGQCRRFIERCFPKAQVEAALSTAAAVELALNQEGAAAISSRRAAEVYGAAILAHGIEDNKANQTRFIVVAPTDHPPTGRDKTSFAFAVAHDRPGTLVRALHEFSDRQINLTRVESRPLKVGLGQYVFLIDLQGHRTDPLVAEALEGVKAQSFFFKIFGSYPEFTESAEQQTRAGTS